MKIAHVCFVGLLMAQPVWAQTDAPISAIDWLSQPGLTPLSEEPLVVGDPARGAELAEIDVIELDAPVEKTYGLIPSKISGIPENFWTDLDPRMLHQILNTAPLSGLPAADDLLLRALLAETLGDESVLNTRVQALIERGAVRAAYSLLGQSQIKSQESFIHFAETALLTGNVERMCRQLNLSRHITEDEALKVYCQARVGSWNTAEVNYYPRHTRRFHPDPIHPFGRRFGSRACRWFGIAECGSEPVNCLRIPTARRRGSTRANTGFATEICAL